MASWYLHEILLLHACLNIIGFVQTQDDWHFNGTNIALNQPTEQHPGVYGSLVSSNGVDGDVDTSFHTDGALRASANWSVELNGSYIIKGIRIYNNQIAWAHYRYRLVNFTITGYPGETILHDESSATTKQYLDRIIYIPVNDLTSYSNITVTVPAHTTTNDGGRSYLNLCEVQIYTVANYCPVPSNGPTTSWTLGPGTGYVYNMFNQVASGSVIDVTCSTNYKLMGASRITCGDDGRYSPDVPICAEIRCKAPDSFDNGGYLHTTDASYAVGEALQWYCSEGYRSDQGKTRHCLDTKVWSEAEPVCSLITCPFPGILGNITLNFINGSVYQTGHVRGKTEINVECEEGFSPDVTTIVCNLDETWDNLPICSQIVCEKLPNITDGNYTYTHENITMEYLNQTFVYGTVASAVCDEGFLTAGTRRVCVDMDTWSGDHHCVIPPPEGEGLPLPIIAGGAGGGVVVIAVVVVIIVCVVRKRKNAGKTESDGGKVGNPSLRFSNLNDAYKPEDTAYEVPKEGGPAADTGETDAGAGEGDTGEYVVMEYDSIHETAIRVSDLVKTVVGSADAANERFKKEFEKFPEGMTKPYDKALENKAKNRFRNLFAYDVSRVILAVWNEERDTDYINASYINGFDKAKAYIAAQGPMKETINDFWKMLWQVKSDKIVMLTNLNEHGKIKCDQYWPDSGILVYGGLQVTLKNTDRFPNYVIRTFLVEKMGQPARHVKQFHFTAWQDNDMPTFCSSLVDFRQKVKAEELEGTHFGGPLIVHCSTGVGRTGAFIAIDYLVNEGRALNYVDVFGCVMKLRRQRVEMVQKEIQYKLIHRVLVEILTCETSCVPTSDFAESYRKLMEPVQGGKRKIDEEFEIFLKLAPKAEKGRSGNSVKSPEKDRHRYIQPAEERMPSLSQQGLNLYEEYINAAFLPMYKDEHALIITQTPLASTVQDFWNMVYHQRVHTIVMMNHVHQMKGPEVYWPEVNTAVTHGDIKVQNTSIEQKGTHNVLHLTAARAGDVRKILLLQFGKWLEGNLLPVYPKHILSALEIVDDNQRETGNHPIVVHCMDGVERSGLFCVVAATLDRTKIQSEVAISQVIQELRSARPNVIPNVDQFVFCHEVVKDFLEQFDIYSNFSYVG